MKLKYKFLKELSVEEMYDIFRLRISVFVVEQNCPYQEMDDADKISLHMWLEDDEGIQAYLRLIPRGPEEGYVSIGRVLAVKRRCGLSTRLLNEAISKAVELFEAKHIYLEAQTYAADLYRKAGFVQISEEFLEDGIPHIGMRLDL